MARDSLQLLRGRVTQEGLEDFVLLIGIQMGLFNGEAKKATTACNLIGTRRPSQIGRPYHL